MNFTTRPPWLVMTSSPRGRRSRRARPCSKLDPGDRMGEAGEIDEDDRELSLAYISRRRHRRLLSCSCVLAAAGVTPAGPLGDTGHHATPAGSTDLGGSTAYPRSVVSTSGLDLSDAAIAERVRRTHQRVFAGYMALQALVGVLFWTALGRLAPHPVGVRPHALAPRGHRRVLPGRPAGRGGRLGLRRPGASGPAARWTVPVLAFTTGGIVYPTLFLVCWVALAGTGEATLAIMLPPSVLSSWVTWRAWSLMEVDDRSPLTTRTGPPRGR